MLSWRVCRLEKRSIRIEIGRCCFEGVIGRQVAVKYESLARGLPTLQAAWNECSKSVDSSFGPRRHWSGGRGSEFSFTLEAKL